MNWQQVIRGFGKPSASGPFTYTISSNTTQTTIDSTLLTGAGWNGTDPVEVVINSGVYVYSTSNTTPALTLANIGVAGTLTVNGYVQGKGGNGASDNDAAEDGGPAISLGQDWTIGGSGYIGGGGGGGGAGRWSKAEGAGGGGAGGGDGGDTRESSIYGGAGGAPGAAGADGIDEDPSNSLTGGGGGGGAGGGGGRCTTASWASASGGGGGRIMPGVGGSSVQGPDIGVGGSAGNPGKDGSPGTLGGSGSGGGGWGAAGGDSTTTGGSGGKAVSLNTHSVTWANWTGTYYGAVS